jgi:hypothetical protein
MHIGSDSIVLATGSQVSTALGNETVILHFQKGSYFGLNEVGSAIWSRLQQPRTVRELCDAVLAEFEVDRERCRQDVLALLERLHSEGLIEIRDEPAA